jgi:hypothetical protein
MVHLCQQSPYYQNYIRSTSDVAIVNLILLFLDGCWEPCPQHYIGTVFPRCWMYAKSVRRLMRNGAHPHQGGGSPTFRCTENAAYLVSSHALHVARVDQTLSARYAYANLALQ